RTPGSLAVSIVSTSVSRASTPASPSSMSALGRIAHNHAHNGVIDRIGGSQRVDINSGVGQRLTHARKCAGTICKENCQLSGGFNGEAGMCIEVACQLPVGCGYDKLGNSGKLR